MRLPNQSAGVTRIASATLGLAGVVPAQLDLPLTTRANPVFAPPRRCPRGWYRRCIQIELEPGTTWRICWCLPTKFTFGI